MRSVNVSPKKITRPLDVYVRVSRVGGREGDSFISPEVQEEKCRALAKARGLNVVHVFTDLDRSGGKMDRPEFKRALTRIESGESGGIIVARIDRFARTLIGGLQAINDINEAGGVVLTADGEFDTSTATGELVLSIMLSLAQFELRRIRENWKEAQDRARARGVHIGKARLGYTRQQDGTLRENEHLEVVREAFALRANGGSWGETVRLFDARGVPTPRGGPWTRQSTQHIITNRAYRAPDGPIPAWQWDKGQPRGDGKRAMRGDGYVLGLGLCRCPTCGTGLVRTHSSGETYLRCPTVGKGHVAVKYDKAEDFILSVAFSHLGPMIRDHEGKDGEALRQAVEAAREEVAVLEEQIGCTLPADSKQRVALEQAEAALAEWQAKVVAPLGLSDILTPLGVRQEFEKLPMPERRRVLRQIVKRVVLKPGRRHIGERLEVEFQDGSYWPASAAPDWVPPKIEGPVWTSEDLARYVKEKQAARAQAAQ
jgi:DNA invertase Pin-like site-specific DNA recombinase